MIFMANYGGRGKSGASDPFDSFLEQGFLGRQRQELLGLQAARKWPQPGAGAAGQDNWLNICHFFVQLGDTGKGTGSRIRR
jgi:hypothetical protein